MEQIYSTGEVSRMLGVQPYQLTYAITIGKLPEPKYRFLQKRCFTQDEIKGIARYFDIDEARVLESKGGK